MEEIIWPNNQKALCLKKEFDEIDWHIKFRKRIEAIQSEPIELEFNANAEKSRFSLVENGQSNERPDWHIEAEMERSKE